METKGSALQATSNTGLLLRIWAYLTSPTVVCVWGGVCLSVYVSICVCLCVYACECVSLCMSMCVGLCICLCLCVYLCMCLHVYNR